MTQPAPALPLRAHQLLLELAVIESKLAVKGVQAVGVALVGVLALVRGRGFYGWLRRAERFEAELDTYGLARRLPIGSSLPGVIGLPRMPRLSRRHVRADALLLTAKATLDSLVACGCAVLAPLAVLIAPLETERGRVFFSTLVLGSALDELVDLYA